MSTAAKTPNYNLSQVAGPDTPDWITDYTSDMSKIDEALKENADDIATVRPDEFSEELTYAAGDYCIKDNVIYKAKTAVKAGAFDISNWTATTIFDELSGLNQNMSDFEDDLSGKQNKISNQTFKFTPNDAGITTSAIQCFRYGNVCIVNGIFIPNQAGTPLTLGSFNVHPIQAITFPITGYGKITGYGSLSTSGIFQCNIPPELANDKCAVNFAFLTA